MVHTSPQNRLAPTSRLFKTLSWGGLAVTAISMTSLVLFSIYHLLSGVFLGTGASPASRVWLIGVIALAIGAASSIVGFTMGVDAEPRSAESEAQARPTIAA